jgi:hypothetical protein
LPFLQTILKHSFSAPKKVLGQHKVGIAVPYLFFSYMALSKLCKFPHYSYTDNKTAYEGMVMKSSYG